MRITIEKTGTGTVIEFQGLQNIIAAVLGKALPETDVLRPEPKSAKAPEPEPEPEKAEWTVLTLKGVANKKARQPGIGPEPIRAILAKFDLKSFEQATPDQFESLGKALEAI